MRQLAALIVLALAGCGDADDVPAPPLLAWCHGAVSCRRLDWRIGGKYGPANISGTRIACTCEGSTP